MTTEEYVGAWKQIVDYYLEQTAETETIVTRQETREAGATQTSPSDAILRQVVALHLEHPDMTTNQIGAGCDTFVNRWLVGDVLRAGKYTPSTGKVPPRVERLRKRMIELGLMSKNPVW